MGKLISILLILGLIVLLGLDWAGRSETINYLFYHLRDLVGDLFGFWATPKGSKLVEEGPFSTRGIAQIVISVLIAVLSLLVIRSERYGPTSRHWAYGAIGVLLGFWLKA
jgi:hypothetical protein